MATKRGLRDRDNVLDSIQRLLKRAMRKRKRRQNEQANRAFQEFPTRGLSKELRREFTRLRRRIMQAINPRGEDDKGMEYGRS